MSNETEFQNLVELFRLTHEQSRKRAAKAIDTSLVVRNWLFGWYIVEFEQGERYARNTVRNS